MKSDLTLTSSGIIFGHTINIQQGYLSPLPPRADVITKTDFAQFVIVVSVQQNVPEGGARLAYSAAVWKPNTLLTCHSSTFTFLFLILSYYFSKAMFWWRGDWRGRWRGVMSFNARAAEHSEGQASYFYRQENIGAAFRFKQLRILSYFPAHKSARAHTHAHIHMHTHARARTPEHSHHVAGIRLFKIRSTSTYCLYLLGHFVFMFCTHFHFEHEWATFLFLMWHEVTFNQFRYLSSRYRESLRAARSGIRTSEGARFSVPLQTGPGAHSASYIMGTGSLSGGRRDGAWRWPPTPI
jgi:hypothetical protein